MNQTNSKLCSEIINNDGYIKTAEASMNKMDNYIKILLS